MPIVPQQNTNEKQIISTVEKFFKDFRISALLNSPTSAKKAVFRAWRF